MKKIVVAVIAAAVVIGAPIATIAATAGNADSQATCDAPAYNTTSTQGDLSISCHIALPAPVTTTETVPGPTTTVPGPTTTVTETQTVTATPAAPTTTPPTSPPTTTTPPPATGFPTAATTGVPAGTTLTVHSGDLVTSSNGQVINGLDIKGDLKVVNTGVKVTNTKVEGRVNNQAAGLSITDSTLGPDACPSGPGDYQEMNGGGFTLIRVHMQSGVGDDLLRLNDPGLITVTDSLFDHACHWAGAHLDAVQLYDPGDKITAVFDHDAFDSRASNDTNLGNSAMFFADAPGPGTNIEIKNSLLSGGQFTLAVYGAFHGSGITYNVHDNKFTNNSWNYGPCSSSKSDPFNGTDGLIQANNSTTTGVAVTC